MGKSNRQKPTPPAPAAEPPPLPDFVQMGQILLDVSQKAQPLFSQFLDKYKLEKNQIAGDPMKMREAYAALIGSLMSNPQKLVEFQLQFWNDWVALCQESGKRFMGRDAKPVFEPDQTDRRFKAPQWQDVPFFDFIKQSYLMTSRWTEKVVHETEGLDEGTRKRIEFQTRQFLDAIAPTNFVVTNPEVFEETLKTQGENLIRGMKNLIEDLDRGQGGLQISTTDYKAFRIGSNIATTPGKVVLRNDLMELIQYAPATEKVFKRPLLVVPPWINKYYILDLRPENSFVKWLVEQGHTVFIVSWVNPDRKLARKRFEDYMSEGIVAALDRMKEITGAPQANVIGYCLGGTLLAVTLAWLQAHGQQDRIASATFMTTLVDFELAGDLKLFMDENQLELMGRDMEEKGFFSADSLKRTFSLLRANDLIWSFVINNYLMGREPFPFDLLYWNDDSTNMPAAMHSFYLRKLYRDNSLTVPGGVTMQGTPIDIRAIATPCYFLSTKEDHIAPWKATYATTQMVKGPHVFTLAASGHVAGVVNPPARRKYCFWSGERTPADPEEWLKQATMEEGSWWPHHAAWLSQHGGGDAPARTPDPAAEDAPGRYVKMKAPA